MALLNGGLTAPAPERGLSAARQATSIQRRQTPRGRKIERAVAQQRTRRQRQVGGPSPAPQAPSVDPGFSHVAERTPSTTGATRAPAVGGPAVGEAVNANLGAQLSRRVSTGAIDQTQADQVAHDRAILEQAYGPKWREKVFGNPKGAKGLPSYGYAGGSEVNTLRSAALKRAKTKIAAE